MTRQGPGVDGTHEPRTPGQAHVLVAHDGGPRAGQVAPVPAHLLAGWLVYDGPVWMGVYGRSDPPQVLPTDAGDAEVWTVCQ
ncbi:hypothetical protein GB931_16910 [Modestobacter sp. I12A-02628]|uniref:Uncharacterized protein n=1 Tax=Goekera deserti TaxID=2497753 RepID=A0A7K3WDT6_9ACTN|nr:hypothetical protein [Goekera deserti]MPQ99566.1 hypothetical protein [Goekera deserti]NDI46422.1 hypothetical protein [Goekera deserti]NEL54645.1 hypothetical protein [Goekera deserti]